MGMYNTFKMDTEAETKGRILEYEGSGFRVTVARAGGSNKRFKKAMEKRARPLRRAIDMEALGDDQARDMLMDVYANTVVVDWEVLNGNGEWHHGIESEDGELLPVTPENIIATFKNLPELFNDIMEQSQRSVLFRASLREAAEGN